MFSVLTGIFTLSVLGVSSALLFLVDVTMPQREGRNEKDDVIFIQNTLINLTDIKVVFARKAFDNQRVVLVLEVEEICHWSTLTSALSTRGCELSVTPLQCCNDYAAELGVNMTYTPKKEIQKFDKIGFFEVVFYDVGKTTDDYITMMQEYLEREKGLLADGMKSKCYRGLGDLPVRFYYFDLDCYAQLKQVFEKDRFEGKASVEMSLLQSFRAYKSTC